MAKARAWTRMSSESWVSPQLGEDARDVGRRTGRRRARRRSSRSRSPAAGPASRSGSRPSRSRPRALVVERLGDAPGDRMVVGDAEDQRLLARRAVPSPPSLRSSSVRCHHARPTRPRRDRPACRPARGSRAAARPRRRHRRSRASPSPGARRGAGRTSRRAAIPYRIVTNTSLVSRATPRRAGASGWARRSRPSGSSVRAVGHRPPTPARTIPGEPLYVLALRRRADRVRRAAPAERTRRRDAPGAAAAAVVIGDSPEA